MSGQTIEVGNYVNTTATAAVTPAPARLIGFYVNSTTAGTIVFRDGGGSGTVVSGTITPGIGFHAFPADFRTSIHVTIANTLDVTLFFQPY